MTHRGTTFFIGAMLLPVLGLAQGTQQQPYPGVPGPKGTPPAPPSAAPAPQIGEAPPGLPEPKMGQRMSQEEWNKWYYQLHTIPKKGAVLVGPKRVRPNRMMSMILEIVSEDETNYVVRNLPPDDPQSAGHKSWMKNEKSEVSRLAKQEYLRDKFLIVNNPEVPPPFTDRLKFVTAEAGLPKGGRWQMSFDIADMNGDGLPDLVFGPQRTGPPTPYIFLQQKDGSWKLWQEAKFPTEGLKLDYGAVRVADFDGDGNKDIAIACHFSKTYVLYGDGKGGFTRFALIPQTNANMTARALTVADVNGDGRPDVVTFAEVDINMSDKQRLTGGLVNIALNLPSGWKAVGEKGFLGALMGDGLTAADIDMDGKVDLLLTSHTSNALDLIYRNLGGGDAWESIGRLQQPVDGYVYANAVGRLDRFKQPDVLECIEQHDPWKSSLPTQACVIYRFHDAQGRTTLTPTPTVLFQEKSDTVIYKAAAIGDIDGDGRDDIVVASNTGRVRVFLQGVDGNFFEQRNAGMDQPRNDIYDLRIADLRHDKKGEVIFAGSPTGTAGGGVWVFRPLKGGAVAPKAP
ncbi:MAG: VCBS repeat-containing protein [Acidobacteriia bacterium]|nr:VCBS repeat-containing protein [Terriglobia bacterium]